jgi:hypothetical protein
MAHLSSETLIDLVEDTIDPSDRRRAAAHLASCGACREQVDEARRMLSVAAEIEVPEPSPLFWDHLSARVREAVAVEDVSPAPVSPASLFARLWAAPRIQVAGVLSACAVAVLAIVTILPDRAAGPDENRVASPATSAVVADTDDDAIAAEASLDLLATLADGMSWDDASEAGLTAAPGAVDDAIMGLTAEERIELQRLLQEELARGGSGGQGALLGSGAVRVQG